MNCTTLDRELRRQNTETFNVVIAYEDASAGLRAMQAYEQLVAKLGDEYCCKCSLWNFKAVESAEFREAATQEAANAEMLIFSAHDGAKLPSEVTTWFASCLEPERRHPVALMALFDRNENPFTFGRTASDVLRQTARRCGMDYFVHTNETASPQADRRRIRFQAPRAVSRHSDTRYWGINE